MFTRFFRGSKQQKILKESMVLLTNGGKTTYCLLTAKKLLYNKCLDKQVEPIKNNTKSDNLVFYFQGIFKKGD